MYTYKNLYSVNALLILFKSVTCHKKACKEYNYSPNVFTRRKTLNICFRQLDGWIDRQLDTQQTIYFIFWSNSTKGIHLYISIQSDLSKTNECRYQLSHPILWTKIIPLHHTMLELLDGIDGILILWVPDFSKYTAFMEGNKNNAVIGSSHHIHLPLLDDVHLSSYFTLKYMNI